MKGTHQTKQRTVKGHTIKISNRTWQANHVGYHVRVDGEKRYHLNVLTFEEAFNIAEERLMKQIEKEEKLQAVETAAKSRDFHTYQVPCDECGVKALLITDWSQGPYATVKCRYCGEMVGKHQPATIGDEPEWGPAKIMEPRQGKLQPAEPHENQDLIEAINDLIADPDMTGDVAVMLSEIQARVFNHQETDNDLQVLAHWTAVRWAKRQPKLFYKVHETDQAYELHISLDEEAVRLHEALDCTFPKAGGFIPHFLKVAIKDLESRNAEEVV